MIDTLTERSTDVELTFIDPYSKNILEVLENKNSLEINYLREEIQCVDLNIFKTLKENDILFVDSSHTLKIGSDLSHILFKIIPSLPIGVIIHIQDIWYPFEYPESITLDGRGYNEAYFIRSFLQYNSSFEILFFGSHLEEKHKELFNQFPGYFKDTGKSLWLKKVA